MKVAPLYHALKKTDWCEPVVVYTGQHYDDNMAGAFIRDLGLPEGNGTVSLACSAGTHAQNTGDTMICYEHTVKISRPDAIVVVGDVDATMACALVGAKAGIPVVHLEAGLRSFDWSMPEEINRVVVDSVSSLLLTPDKISHERFRNTDGKPHSQAHCVGNIMIDAFEMLRPQIEAAAKRPGPYAVVTLHRPSNVDNKDKLIELLDEVRALAQKLTVFFPVHPRTYRQIHAAGELPWLGIDIRIKCSPPLPYVKFMGLVKNATIVITDSGGVQEETSYLGIPCATVRENTERPITISHGTNELIKPSQIVESAQKALMGNWKKGVPIPLWDGHTAERCVAALQRFLA